MLLSTLQLQHLKHRHQQRRNLRQRKLPADTTANTPNYLRGFVPGELTTDELFEVCGDNLTADMLVDNNVIDKKTGI